MKLSRALFLERKEEINLYFELLVDVIDNNGRLVFPLPKGATDETRRREKEITKDLTHTLKANGFLLLYNLVEATMTSAIEDIHQAIGADENIGIDDLLDPLRNRAIERFKPNSKHPPSHLAHPISKAMVRFWLEDHRQSAENERNPLFSGNVDARAIRGIAEMYGFSSDTDVEKTRDGARLVNVKSKRNDLAHGHIAFKDCGRDLVLSDLLAIKDEVINYLDCILANIEAYLAEGQYLRPKAEADGFRQMQN